MSRFVPRLIDALLKPINPAATILLGIYTILWGVWIGNPWWSVFDHSRVFSQMDHQAPEWFYGAIAIVVGVLICRGAIAPSYRSLTLGAVAGFVFWTIISGFYFAGDWQSTASLVAAYLALSSGFVYVNVSANYRGTRNGTFHA